MEMEWIGNESYLTFLPTKMSTLSLSLIPEIKWRVWRDKIKISDKSFQRGKTFSPQSCNFNISIIRQVLPCELCSSFLPRSCMFCTRRIFATREDCTYYCKPREGCCKQYKTRYLTRSFLSAGSTTSTSCVTLWHACKAKDHKFILRFFNNKSCRHNTIDWKTRFTSVWVWE